MKKIIKSHYLLLVVLFVVLHSCRKEELPTLSTSSVSNITATGASSGGNITSDGGAEIISRGVCWAVNPNPTTSDLKTSDGTGAGQFVSNLNGLSAGLTYHVRAYASNKVGTAYGADLSFVTLGKAPECITQAATNILAIGATLNGTVNANHLSTTVTFEYGLTTSYGQTLTPAQNPVTGNNMINVSADLSGLTPGTAYHYRVRAVNSIGTTNGNDLSFTTGAVLPMLTTTLISNRTATSVTTGGNIISDGSASITARGVCWSTTYNPTILNSKTSDGTGSGSFTSNITGLTPGTLYYLRAYATNGSGTAYGEELTFTTLATVPILTTASIIDKTRTTATSGGNIISDGGSGVTARGVCWSTTSNPTTDGSHTSSGAGSGIFTSSLTSLTPGTTYYVRAYATNNAGTGYGNEVSFTTNPYELATLTTNQTISITENIAISGGNITSDGGSAITARGVCWSTTLNPTIAGSHTSDGIGTGSFSSDIRCLYDATIYYVRAYATNIAGTAYGNQQSIITNNDPITFNPTKTYGLVSDIDGNCYKTIQIGDEIWMAENLKTSRYNDGTPIPNVTDNTEWENLLSSISNPPYVTTGAYCWYNNDSATYENVYGKLYNWGVVNTDKICPLGWHVPDWIDGLEGNPISDDCYLDDYLGGKLMETGSIHWINPNLACINNQTGFTAIPSGKRNSDGTFTELGYTAYFWVPGIAGHGPLVINQKVPHTAFYCQSPTSCGIFTTEGHSIRCVKDY